MSDTKPLQNKVITQGLTDVLETIGSGASQAYSEGDIILCTDGYWYQASTDIAQNNTLVLNGNVTKTNQRALNTSLTEKVTKFSGTFDSKTYVTVDQLAYDSTNQTLGLKVNGADTVIPFSKGGKKRFNLSSYNDSTGAWLDIGQDQWKKITCIANTGTPTLRIDKDGAFLQYLAVGSSYDFESGHSYRLVGFGKLSAGTSTTFDLE